jgi:enoyl-CoA hydratase
VDRHGPVTVVTIDRPHRRNAVDRVTADALEAAFARFDADDTASVAVLTGADGTFCAGADLQAIASGTGNRVAEDGPGPMGPTRMALSKPVIAAVEGHAVAGGLELAVWCDLRVAGADAVFGVFCRRFGVPLVDGGTIRLPRLVGEGRAMDLILSGRPVGAQEALAMGLANRIVPTGTALQAALVWAEELAALPQVCMRNDRKSAIAQWNLPVADALLLESRFGLASLASGEALAGAARFRGGAGRGGSPVTSPDADGTLTNGGSVFDFLTAVSGRQAVLRASAALAPRLAHAAVVGGAVADATKEELFVRVLSGVDAAYLDQVGAEFAIDHLAAHIRPEVRRRLDWHRGRGDDVVVVSASLDAYIRVAAGRLAADGAIATRLEVDGDGRLTGRYDGGNCRGEEKIRRLRLWMADAGLEGARLWAYGNSRGDLRMLRSADTGVDVGRLRRIGRLRDFNGLDKTGPHRLDG